MFEITMSSWEKESSFWENKFVFTVEIDATAETVEIYCDSEGLDILQRSIDVLRRTKSHDHLMTSSWVEQN